MSDNTPIKPWYKQNWLWFLLSVPIASVILSSIMVYVAVEGKDSLVSDNYYKDGMAINQTIEQDRLAKSLNLKPRLTISPDGIAEIKMDTSKIPPQAYLTLKILHPTLKSADVVVKLLPTESSFVADIPPNIEGRRYIDLYSFDETWRIREEVILPLSDFILNNQ